MTRTRRLDRESAAADCRFIIQSESEDEAIELGENHVREVHSQGYADDDTVPYGGWKEVLDAGGWVGATDRLEPIEAPSRRWRRASTSASRSAPWRTASTSNTCGPAFGPTSTPASASAFQNVTAEIEIDGEDLEPAVDEWAQRVLVSLARDVDPSVETPTGTASDD